MRNFAGMRSFYVYVRVTLSACARFVYVRHAMHFNYYVQFTLTCKLIARNAHASVVRA